MFAVYCLPLTYCFFFPVLKFRKEYLVKEVKALEKTLVTRSVIFVGGHLRSYMKGGVFQYCRQVRH